MKKIALMSLLMFLFIGCQNSSTDVSKDYPLNPEVLISNLQENGNVLKGTLKISETNDFYSNVIFNNVSLSSSNCKIQNFKPTTIKNNSAVDFEANISCNQPLSALNVNFDEIAQYMDTDIKSVKKSFSINYSLNQVSTESNISDFSLGIINIQPSSITLNTGESYTFSVYTFDKDNNPVNVPVKIDPPIDNNGNIVGDFDKYYFQTLNGKGQFTYIAPSELNQNDVNLTVKIKINNNIDKNISIEVMKNTQVIINPTKLILVPNSITLASDASYEIKIFTLDNNNRGVSAKVLLSYPIDDKNNSWGTFDKYSLTTNENGEGSVTFQAVKNINSLEGNLSVPITIQSTGLTSKLLLITPVTSANKQNASYKIDYIVPSSVGVDNSFDMTVKIINALNDVTVDGSRIKEINLTSENHLVYFDNNTSKFTKTFDFANNINFKAHSSIISGIDIIDVNSTVINDDNTTKEVSTQIPVIIVSGPVSAISINPIGSSFNSNTGLFEHTYSIHAVDKYSNPVQKGTKIKVGAVINAKIISTNGKITANSDKFSDTTQNFTNDLINNTLVVFADSNHKDPLYLGGWTVEDVLDSNDLKLASIFNGENDVSSLSYVIGDEKRYNSCDSTLALADFDSADKTYETDEQGIAKVVLRFDPYLVGKTVSLYADSFQNKRVGVSIKRILFNNNALYNELNEDENVSHIDSMWEKSAQQDENKSGTIYIGTNGGATNTVVGDSSTLLRNSPVTLRILTTSICKFTDGTTSKTMNTSCNGGANFTVHYDDNGTCKVELNGINYEY